MLGSDVSRTLLTPGLETNQSNEPTTGVMGEVYPSFADSMVAAQVELTARALIPDAAQPGTQMALPSVLADAVSPAAVVPVATMVATVATQQAHAEGSGSSDEDRGHTDLVSPINVLY